jgi:hypothetical protein
MLFEIIFFAASISRVYDPLSSPSVRANILAIALGYFYFYSFNLSTAKHNASYNLVLPYGSAASTAFLNNSKSLVNS